MKLIENGMMIQIPVAEEPRSMNQEAIIAKRTNGFTTYEKKVSMLTIIESIFYVLEPYEAIQNVFEVHPTLDADVLAEVIRRSSSSSDLDIVSSTFIRAMINLIAKNDKAEIITLFYQKFHEQYDFDQLSIKNPLHLEMIKKALSFSNCENIFPDELKSFVRDLSNKVRSLDDPTEVYQLFEIIFNQLDLLSCNREIIRSLLTKLAMRATRNKDKQIKTWFGDIIESMTEGEKVHDTPILPSGAVYYRKNNNGVETVCIRVEKGNHDIIYHQSEIDSVGHPALLFCFSLRKNKVRDCKIVAIKDEFFTKDSKIYKYPFGNVFHSSNACWKEVNNKEILDLHDLHGLIRLFFSSPTNDHGYNGNNLKERYVTLRNHSFDDNELVEFPKTFSELIIQ